MPGRTVQTNIGLALDVPGWRRCCRGAAEGDRCLRPNEFLKIGESNGRLTLACPQRYKALSICFFRKAAQVIGQFENEEIKSKKSKRLNFFFRNVWQEIV
jgi:hypothetical protein